MPNPDPGVGLGKNIFLIHNTTLNSGLLQIGVLSKAAKRLTGGGAQQNKLKVSGQMERREEQFLRIRIRLIFPNRFHFFVSFGSSTRKTFIDFVIFTVLGRQKRPHQVGT
jgi:hypothetical protein